MEGTHFDPTDLNTCASELFYLDLICLGLLFELAKALGITGLGTLSAAKSASDVLQDPLLTISVDFK